MSWIGTAVVGSTVLGAVGSSMAKDAAGSAASKNTTLAKKQWQQIQQNEQPYMQAGNSATSRLSDLLGTSGNTDASGYGSLTGNFTYQDYLNNQDPGYQFQLQQGSQALQNAASAGSGSLSGSALKDLIGYNQAYAATGYQNAYDRWNTNQNNIYNRLYGVSSLGQNAASNTGTQQNSITQSQMANNTSYTNALGSAYTGTANNVSSGLYSYAALKG